MPIFPFRRKVAAQPAPVIHAQPATAPGTSIRWDGALVPRLQGEHRLLVKRYRQLVATLDAGDYEVLPPILDKFRSLLLDHLLTENTRLYVYLRHQIEDPAGAELINAFSREMDQIGREVMAFIRHTDTASVRTRAWAEQLRAMGGALQGRIEREEMTLYPLYQPIYR